ncbi:unnamed protein product [Somion occarium]|uniref:Uncharacterized protein n=1 Tax=Somion occarium TaxID=3059160 RepID=A0ABP1ECT4_9APHY
MQSTYPSTTTLNSVDSSTPLKNRPLSKDYFAAFGSLQSSFGLGGRAPGNSSRSSSTKKISVRTQASRTNSPPVSQTSSSGTKDYEAAFGSLSSDFGFGASTPSPLHRSSKKNTR